jgi:hypothetical protein
MNETGLKRQTHEYLMSFPIRNVYPFLPRQRLLLQFVFHVKEGMEEDDIDNETIQARVNASLAYVNDLVSSWMKPPKNPSSHKDVEKEIEELMRRPPRYDITRSCAFLHPF